MPRTRLALVAFVVATALPSLAHTQKVWVVAPTPGPGVDFTSIVFAVNSAASGDLVLVRSGTYAPFELFGKGVYVIEDTAADVTIAGAPTLALRNTSAAQTTWLHGLSYGGASQTAVKLEATDCAGPVLLTHIQWSHSAVIQFSEPPPALRAKNCADLVIDSCVLVGTPGGKYCCCSTNCACNVFTGGNALQLESSSAALFDSVLSAGSGVAQSSFGFCSHSSGLGGVGAKLDHARLLLQSTVTGGNGGAGGESFGGLCFGAAKCGSPGVQFIDASSQLTIAGGAVSAGQPGQTMSTFACTPPTCSVPAIDGPGTTVQQAPLPELTLPALAREGAAFSATLSAPPGIAALIVGTSIDALEFAGVSGWLLASGAISIVPLGAVPPSGSLSVPAVISDLGAGVDFAVLYLQAGHCNAGGSCGLGVVRPIALLDAQF